jgi:hypothetical protein
MRVNRVGTVMPQSGLEETAKAKQATAAEPTSSTKALEPTAQPSDLFGKKSPVGATAEPAFLANSENPLQSRPMEVLGGALMASKDLEGLRDNLIQLQTQIVVAILNEVVKQLTDVTKQLLGGLQGPGGSAPGQIGQTPGAGASPYTPGGGYGPGLPPAGSPPVGAPPSGGVTPGQPPAAGAPIPVGVNYQNLSTAERNAMSGMSERERGVLHLWGIQMGSAGKQDGGVLLNVLQNPGMFKPAEVQIAQELAAKEQQMYGGITGKSLDGEFFGLYQKLTGKDISQRYGNAPINFAQGPVNLGNRQTGANGLSNFDNEVLQLWGHSPLFTGGKIDGSILNYAMNSPNRMEVNLNQNDLKALWDADLASDGVINGDSLENAMVDVLDRVYLGAPSATPQKTLNDAMQEAAQRRQGLLPPSQRPAADLATPTLDAIAQSQAKRVGGSCPFVSLPQ